MTPMNRFSTTKVEMMMKGMKNSQAQGCCCITGRTMPLVQSSIVISWNSVKKLSPSVPNFSGSTSA